MNSTDTVDNVITQLLKGVPILYPTETLPGIGFDPRIPMAKEALCHLKQRDMQKPMSALVSSLAMACEYWQPLPKPWSNILSQVWPAPLTVVWQVKPTAPEGLQNLDQTCGFRFPLLPTAQRWVLDVIAGLGVPLISTSVNRAGEPAIVYWAAACEMVKEFGFYIPSFATDYHFAQQASTVIALEEHGYKLLRPGGFSLDELDKRLY